MEIKQIRMYHINYWADKLGRDVLAQKIGYSDTIYVNQLCRGHGSFGSKTARKIEKALRLPYGAFDSLPAEITETVDQEVPEGLPLLTPELAVLWKEDKLPDLKLYNAIRLGEQEVQKIGFKLTLVPGDRVYLLRYTGPVLPQFSIAQSPILLLINLDQTNSSSSTVWLINSQIRIGVHEKFDQQTQVLDFLDPAQGRHRLDLTTDNLLGWLNGVIFLCNRKTR